MSCNGVAMFPLGQKGSTTEIPSSVGLEVCFKNVDYTQLGIQDLLSGNELHAVLVKNRSGGALSKGTAVTWASGHAGTGAGAVTAGVAVAAGVVDPFLTTTVADGELFWLIRRGRVPVLSSAAINANAIIVPTADGKFVTQTVDAAGVNARCGRQITAATDANQHRLAYVDFSL